MEGGQIATCRSAGEVTRKAAGAWVHHTARGGGIAGRSVLLSNDRSVPAGKGADRPGGVRETVLARVNSGSFFVLVCSSFFLSCDVPFWTTLHSGQGWSPSKVFATASASELVCE